MDAFKADFIAYLRKNGLLEKTDLDKKDAQINTSNYNDELKGFLDNYKIDENELIESKIDVNEVLEMDFDDFGNLDLDDNDKTDEKKDVFGGFFDFLINQDGIKEQIDENKDGKISKDEITKFTEAVASKDGNMNDITLKDMFDSYEQIEKNEFDVNDINNQNLADTGDNQETDAGNTTSTSDNNTTSQTAAVITQDEVEGLDDTELQEQGELQSDALTTSKKNAEDALLNGTNASPSNEEVDSAYNSYLEMVESVDTEDKNFAQQLTEQKAAVDECEYALHLSEVLVAESQLLCDSCARNVASAEEALSAAQAQANQLQGQNVSDEAKGSANAAVAQAQQALGDAKDEQTKAESDHEQQVESRDLDKEALEDAQNALMQLQMDIAAANTENQAALNELSANWNNLREANEQSRQENFKTYSDNATVYQYNVDAINAETEIRGQQSEEEQENDD